MIVSWHLKVWIFNGVIFIQSLYLSLIIPIIRGSPLAVTKISDIIGMVSILPTLDNICTSTISCFHYVVLTRDMFS